MKLLRLCFMLLLLIIISQR